MKESLGPNLLILNIEVSLIHHTLETLIRRRNSCLISKDAYCFMQENVLSIEDDGVILVCIVLSIIVCVHVQRDGAVLSVL